MSTHQQKAAEEARYFQEKLAALRARPGILPNYGRTEERLGILDDEKTGRPLEVEMAKQARHEPQALHNQGERNGGIQS